jgi:hypothetical protein
MAKIVGIFAFCIVLLVSGCQNATVIKPQVGDLLFQDVDCGGFCDAIEKVTTGYSGVDFTHVGIVARNSDGKTIVLEAGSDGVKSRPLKDFLGVSADKNGCPKVIVGRLKQDYRHLIKPAITEGFSLVGRPYDKAFVINNDSYYCSELIYEIFLRANDGKPLFELQPMTFNDPDTGQIFHIWQEYFDKLNVPVPQGEPGINPGGISRASVIDIVHCYGMPDGWRGKLINNCH